MMGEKYIQRVLSVDDIEDNNFLIYSYLKPVGIQTFMASSGKQALEMMEEKQFHLFLLDIMMTGMDGFELARKIREKEKYKYTPIIFISGIHSDASSIFKGYQSGAIDYLLKPVDKTILVNKVRFLLSLDQQKNIITRQRDELIERQQRFMDVAESLADWIWEIDSSGKYIYVSEKVKEVLGYESHELIGKSPFDFMPASEAKKIKEKFEKILKERAAVKDLINWNISKSGEARCLLTNGVPFFDKNDRLIGYRGVDKDITAKIKNEEDLLFQAKLLQNVNDSIIYADLEGIIQYVNEGTYYTFGYKLEELAENTLSLLFPEQYKDISIAELFVVIDFKPYESIWQGKNKKGESLWLDVKISLMHASDGKPEGYIIVSKDITFLKKAEKEILRSLIVGEDNERKRLAFDLHDGLGQILTASSLSFNSLKKDFNKLSEKSKKQYNSGLAFINKAMEETRNISHNLMPKSIGHFGLISAITSLFKSIQKTTTVKISISENIGDHRLDEHVEMNMYRITQEILNNAIKHSKAKNASFQYRMHEKELIFTYEDDGLGFTYDPINTAGDGLKNINTRVASMSGFVSINSKVGKGTSISIEILL
ncbi:PAS domain S-box protein [Bacteroidota bacterium]